jgi:hypothetical protein
LKVSFFENSTIGPPAAQQAAGGSDNRSSLVWGHGWNADFALTPCPSPGERGGRLRQEWGIPRKKVFFDMSTIFTAKEGVSMGGKQKKLGQSRPKVGQSRPKVGQNWKNPAGNRPPAF